MAWEGNRVGFRLRAFLFLALALAVPACGPGSTKTVTPPPEAPFNFTLTPISTSQIRLDWSNPASNATFNAILRSTDGTTFNQIALLSSTSETYSDFGLQPSTFYWYRVVARNRGGDSPPLEDVTVTQDLFWNGPVTGGPASRGFHSAVYDPLKQRMIVFAGNNGTTLHGDLWELSLPDPALGSPGSDLVWSLMPCSGLPPARAGHSAIYDSTYNRMIVFGGQNGSNLTVNELWILDLNPATPVWTQITSSNLLPANQFTGTPPSGRRNHTAIYDPVRKEMIVFGGSVNGSIIPDDDIYVLKLPASGPYAWSSPIGPGLPPIWRDLTSTIYDPIGARMILFAGHDNDPTNGNIYSGGDGSSLNNEIWSLSATQGYAWNLLQISGTPGLRHSHTSVYDVLNRRMVVFGGGADDLFTPLAPPNFFALNLSGTSSWTQLTPFITGPGGLFSHSAIYDARFNRMVIFGGIVGSPFIYTDEAWWIGM